MNEYEYLVATTNNESFARRQFVWRVRRNNALNFNLSKEQKNWMQMDDAPVSNLFGANFMAKNDQYLVLMTENDSEDNDWNRN